MKRIALQALFLLVGLSLCAGAGHARALTDAQRADLLAHVSPDRIQADTDGNGLFDNLEATMAHAPPDQRIPVIVRYKAGHEAAAQRIGERATLTLTADRSVAARLTSAEIRGLIASGEVETIEEDLLCQLYRDTSQASFGITKARTDFGLNGHVNSDPKTYSSKDIVIAVIDTGIDGNHPDFVGGKIIGWKDFVSNRSQPYDDDGHGTFAASIAAGAINNVGGVMVGGVAPGAALVGVRISGAGASATLATGANAIQWCIDNKDQFAIKVISISWGFSLPSDGTDAVSRAVDRATAAGLVVVCAAGNAGPWTYTVGSPAAAQTAIGVGSMADLGSPSVANKNGFALDFYSSRGPTVDGRVKPDVLGPGRNILAANANHANYRRDSGTSFSAPFVAGLAALILQANPQLSPADVKNIVKSTAVHFGRGSGDNNDFGSGRVDGYAALAKALGKTGTPPAVPKHTFKDSVLSDRTGDATILYGAVVPVTISDIQFPIAVTMLVDSPDSLFDIIALLDPSQNAVAYSDESYLTGSSDPWPNYPYWYLTLRQKTLRFRPRVPGTYTLLIGSLNLPGTYTLDISAGSN